MQKDRTPEDREKEASFDSKVFPFFFALLLYEGVSGLYLYLSTTLTIPRQFTILSHILLGFLLLLPLLLHQPIHIIRSWQSTRRGMKGLGYLGCGAILLSSITGVLWSLVGGLANNPWLTQTHLISSLVALLLPLPHLGIFLYTEKSWRPLKVSVPMSGLLGAMMVGLIFFLSSRYKAMEYRHGEPKGYTHKWGDNPFHPSETMTSTGSILDARALGNSRSCGRDGCHQDIYAQWYASVHRQSSTDIFYRRTEEYMIQTEGIEATRYCGGCHDPIALLSGAMMPGGSLDSPHSEEGISCVVCHSITQIRHLRGSGSFLVTPPPAQYLFEGKEGPVFEELNALVVRSDAALHKQAFSRDFYKKPEYCAVCHKQFIGKDTNHWGWLKLQDQYGSWLASRFSGRNGKGFFVDQEVQTCNDCHMPLVKSDDPAAGPDGRVRSHRYIAANTVLPWLAGDKVQFKLTEEWLKRRPIFLDIYEPRERDGTRGEKFISQDIYHQSEIVPYVYMGDTLDLQVAVTNVEVGHHFPDGPIDIQEVWVELKVVDSQGGIVFWSGKLDEEGHVDKKARFYQALGVDRYGKLIDKHNLWDMIGNVYAKTIPPGETDIPTYRFEIPYWTQGDLTVMARLRYRKLNQWYTNWALGRKDVRLPIIDMARDILTIPVKKRREQETVAVVR